MTVKAGTAYVDFEGDFSALNKQVASHFRRIDKQAQATGKQAGGRFRAGLASGITAGAKIGAVGVAALGAEVFKATKGWSEHVALQRRSSAVIRSTGEAANVTAKHVERLSDSIEKQSGLDGDLIQNGANLLLTFTNIRNGVGKNNKIFDQATRVTANMSKALGQDTKSSAIQLGKALNDPIKGITALSRVGVSFTQEQKDQIKALVDSGKSMQAQKIILRELNREFPKVKATPFERLVTVGRQVEDTIGKAVLPVFNKLVREVTPGLQRIADKFDNILGDKGLSAGEKLNRMFAAVKVEVEPLVRNIVQSLREADLGGHLNSLARSAAPKIAEGLKTVGETAASALWEGFKAAPLWAKVAGAGFVAKALLGGGGAGGIGGGGGAFATAGGLAAKAFKASFAAGAVKLATGSGITAKIATFFTGRGSTPANPLFVADISGGLPGSRGRGGTPVPLPGGKTGGKFGKITPFLKGAGKLGAAGAAIDFGVNLVDSKGDPIRATVNTASDLTFGIIPRMKTPEQEAAAKGNKLIAKIPVDVRPQLTPDSRARIQTLIADIDKRMNDSLNRPASAGIRGGVKPKEQILKDLKLNEADKNQIAKNAAEIGRLTATSYANGLKEQHQFFDASSLTGRIEQQLKGPLKGMPQAAKQAAVDTMVEFARGLEQEGRLPKGATAEIIRNVKSRFGLLPTFMRNAGKQGMDALAAQLKRNDVINAAEKQRTDLKRTWDDFPRIAKFSGQNAVKNFTTEISFLKDKVKHSDGAMKQQAITDLKDVKEQYRKFGRESVTGFDSALRNLGVGGSKRMGELRDKIVGDARRMAMGVKGSAGQMQQHLDQALQEMGIKGSKKARHVRTVVSQAMSNMASNVGGSSGDAATALYKALENMGENGDAILAALGIKRKKKQFNLKVPPLAPGANGQLRPTQRGGAIPGSRLGDRIPSVLEEGEYVLNRKAVAKAGVSNLDRFNFGDAPRFQKGGYAALSRRANEIEGQHYPYRWGGGHDASFSGPYDCSGAISAILHAAGLLNLPMVSGQFMNFGLPGPGNQFTIWANPEHVYGRIGNRYWGTSNANPGGGAGYFEGEPRSGFAVRHVVMVPPEVPRPLIEGPGGMLRDAAQGEADQVRSAINSMIQRQMSMGQVGGGDFGDSATASGNGADLMRQISRQRNWNFNDWWALDESETGHGANLSNPASSARLRGQFLDMNYGKYGPGSDPSAHPSMGQQIESMAQYIAARYGNPTKAWAFHQAHNYYQRGGVVGGLMSLFQPGGPVAKAKGAKAKNNTVAQLRHARQHKPTDHLSKKMVDSLGNAGATNLQAVMDTLRAEADKYADWAQRANDITDTDALQAALNNEMTIRGGRSNMTDPELLKLFPTGDQDAFIQSWMRQFASFNGGIQTDWLGAELNQLLAWRNALIDNPPIFQGLLDAARAAYAKLKAELKRIADDITLYEKRRDNARQERDRQNDLIKDAKKDLEDNQDALQKERKKKQSKKRDQRIEELEKKIANAHDRVQRHRHKKDEAEAQIENYNKRLQGLRARRKAAREETQVLGGDNGEPGDRGDGPDGRISKLTESITDMGASLVDVQGLGSTLQKFVDPSQFQLGTLGGTILGVQNEIVGLTRNPPRASAELAGADPEGTADTTEDQTKEILAQLLREANLRTAVSEAEFGAFRGLPFGGSFGDGGTVPGPLGAPRVIVAHGGEVVSNDRSNNGPNVSIHVANGMEWLRQFVDVRVEGQTRPQGRRAERQLPGRPGLPR